MGGGGGSPRRRSAERTREKLLEAGRAAFAARGLDGVVLQRDVLTPAGVSVGSFYHQFKDKTDLFVAVIEGAGALGREVMMGPDVDDPFPTDPVAATRAVYERWFTIVDHAEDTLRIHMRERDHSDERVRAALARIRTAWIESWARSFRRFAGDGSGFDPQRAAQVVVALGLGLLFVYLDAPPEDRPQLREELIDTVVPFTLGGFVALGASKPTDP